MGDLVLILGYDAAGSRAVAQALRAEQIYCRIVSPAISREEAAAQSPRGLILAGGVSGEIPAPVDPGLLDGSWPVLALGDAAAMLCRKLGGDAMNEASKAINDMMEGLKTHEDRAAALRRAAMGAASLQRLARSAPVKPGVSLASDS